MLVPNDVAHDCLGFLLGIFSFEGYSLQLAAAHHLDLIIWELTIPTTGAALAHSDWHELKIVTAAFFAAVRSFRHPMCGRPCLHSRTAKAVPEKVIRASSTLFRYAALGLTSRTHSRAPAGKWMTTAL